MVDGRPITAPYEFVVIGVAAEHGDGDEHPRRRGASDITSRGGVGRRSRQSDEVVVDALRPLDTPQYASPDDRRLSTRRPAAPAPPDQLQETIAAWPRRTTAATPTSTSGRWCRAPTARRPSCASGSPTTRRTRSATSSSSSCPRWATRWRPGTPIGEVESTKSVSDVYAPVAGVVAAVNDGAGRRAGDDQRRSLRRGLAGRDQRRRARAATRSAPCSTPPPTRHWSTRRDGAAAGLRRRRRSL